MAQELMREVSSTIRTGPPYPIVVHAWSMGLGSNVRLSLYRLRAVGVLAALVLPGRVPSGDHPTIHMRSLLSVISWHDGHSLSEF